jgi:hypothetical protein
MPTHSSSPNSLAESRALSQKRDGVADRFRVVKQSIEQIDVSTLFVHPKNAQQHDVGKLHESIEKNGFVGAIVVWKHREPLFNIKLPKNKRWVLAGAGRLGRVIALGGTHIPAFVVDVDRNTAESYLLADNESSKGATYSDENLVWLLQQRIDAASGDIAAALDGTLFSGDDVDDLIERLNDANGTGAETQFGNFTRAPADAEGFVALRIGDFSGRISNAVYKSFEQKYHAIRGTQRNTQSLLDDVFRAWLDLKEE